MPRYNNHTKTNRYIQEFKSKAVQLSHLTGVQVKDVAQALDIHPFMLSRWRKEYREGKIVADKRKKKIRFYTDRYTTHFKVRLDEDGSVTESFAVARSTDADINQQKERNNLQAMPFNRHYAGENVLRGE